jgi:RHS repeat-associated protein
VEADHLGTPRQARDDTGRLVWRWMPGEPFGSDEAEPDPDGDGTPFDFNLRFPGQYLDRETGLHYNINRDYDPRTGRYTSFDPIGLAGGINGYTYANNAPTMYTDPLGLKPVPCPPGLPPSATCDDGLGNQDVKPTCASTECLTYNANLDPSAKILYCDGGRLKMCGPAIVNVGADCKKCNPRKAPLGADCLGCYSSCVDLGSCISDTCEMR